MRIIIKGGVWKNTEDEILKVAVMKYGKNQWARISSLLNRKSPKQCKARWYEWLDPSIKKTEWSKEEDEKLLHLAKLMPTQWRTIAPIVGRTPAQCLERYQRLLDDAEAKEGEDLEAPSADDVRRLRPGEIDPDPESKPARPDPIDMDEDEKEMLSEARARLANTQGKKAKRKARERQLEESRRLAQMQKRRELRAAGVDYVRRKRKNEFDYNGEVPFQVHTPAGFFDTSEERMRQVDKTFVGRPVNEMEKATRAQREEDEKQAEIKKRKNNKDKTVNFDLPNIKSAENEQMAKRRKLALPAPQIGEAELEEIVKLGQANEMARTMAGDAEGTFSQNLLGDYDMSVKAQIADRTPLPTRTPKPSDTIRAEAANILALQSAQTPLLGGENTQLRDGGTGFEGVTPARPVMATPNPVKEAMTPRHGSQFTGPRVPGSVRGTPLRDDLNLNRADAAVEEDLDEAVNPAKMEKLRLHNLRRQLDAGLSKLPKPKNDFEIVLPDEDETEADGEIVEEIIVEDQQDVQRQRRKQLSAEEAEQQARQSSAVRRDLPRPYTLIDPKQYIQLTTNGKDGERRDVERLIAEAVCALVNHDAVQHPPEGVQVRLTVPVDTSAAMLDELTSKDLKNAADLIAKEAGEMPKDGSSLKHADRWFLVPGDQTQYKSVYAEKPNKQALTEAAKCHFEINSVLVENMAAQTTKLHKRLQTLLGGYMARSQGLKNQISQAQIDLEDSQTEVESFKTLLAREQQSSIPSRINKMQQELDAIRRCEAAAQQRYQKLQDEIRELKQ